MKPPLWQRAVLLKNSAAILGARVVIPVSFFALSIAVARLLGPESLGHYAIVMSLYAIFTLLSTMGLENLILRDVSREPEKAGAYCSHALVLGMVSSSVCALLMLLTSHLLGHDAVIRQHLLWLSLVLLPGFINNVAELLFIARHRADYAFGLALAREGTLVLLSILWLLDGQGLRGVIWALIVSRGLGAALALLFFRRLGVRFSRRLEPEFLRRLVALIPPFLLINLLSNTLLEIDILILSSLVAAPEVGLYMVAKKLVRASFLLTFSVVTALFPDISQAFQRSDPRFEGLFKILWRRTLWATTALAGLIFLLAEWGIFLTYGPQYASAVELMRILAWILIPLSLSFLLSRFLIIGDQQNKDLAALAIAVSALVVSGITGALGWGVHGMAVANVMSISLLAAIHYGLAQRFLFKPYGARLAAGPLPAEAVIADPVAVDREASTAAPSADG